MIQTAEDLKQAVQFDHVSAAFKNNYRMNSNFIQADHIAMDVDNDHTEKQSEWLDVNKLKDLLPNVAFMVSYSRHHMKQKGNLSSRPRFHVYFPIKVINDVDEYKNLKQRLAQKIIGFDSHALDASRLLFGVTQPQVLSVEGDRNIDEYLDALSFENLDFSTQEIIQEGSRNSTLNHFAGRVLKRLGERKEAHQLFLEKADQFQPPLKDDELEAIWRSAVKFSQRVSQQAGYVSPDEYKGEYSYKPDDYSDVGQALVLEEHFNHKLRYSTSTGFLVYNGSYWDESDTQAVGVVRELTDAQLEEEAAGIEKYRQLLEKSGGMQLLNSLSKKKALEALNEDQLKLYHKLQEATAYHEFVMKRRNQNYIQAALRIVEHLVEVEPTELDSDPFLLNTPSGTYDLRTGECFEHNADQLITKQTEVDVKKASSPIWQEALETFFLGDQELMNYVQEIMGLALVGKVYVEALIIAYGDGSNGKSTFWNTLLRVLGTYGDAISADVLVNQSKRNVKPEIAETKGKRLLIAAELQEGMSLNTSIIKQLCSTDLVRGEKKFKKPFSFMPSYTLVLYTNHLSKVSAMDNGTWRRLTVIPFEATIKGNKDIKNYSDHLFKTCGPAILWWAIEGAKKAIAKDYHLVSPSRVKAAINSYRHENDWFQSFIDECCQIGKDNKEKSGEFYEAYRSYCYRTGEDIKNSKTFYEALKKAGFNRRKSREGSFIYGVSLISEFL